MSHAGPRSDDRNPGSEDLSEWSASLDGQKLKKVETTQKICLKIIKMLSK